MSAIVCFSCISSLPRARLLAYFVISPALNNAMRLLWSSLVFTSLNGEARMLRCMQIH